MAKGAATVSPDAALSVDREEVGIGKFFKITPVGLQVLGRPPLDVCGDMAELLRVMEGGLQWTVGDFINWTEGQYGEEASQLIDSTEWSESTIKVYTWVAAKVPFHIRRKELTFSHHQIVAELVHDQQKLWLERAVEGDGDGKIWSTARLQRELKAGTGEAGAVKFQVIVECKDADDVDALCRQLDNLGRTDYKKVHGNSAKETTA